MTAMEDEMSVLVLEDLAAIVALHQGFQRGPSFGGDCLVVEEITPQPKQKRIVHAVGDYRVRDVEVIGFSENDERCALRRGMTHGIGID